MGARDKFRFSESKNLSGVLLLWNSAPGRLEGAAAGKERRGQTNVTIDLRDGSQIVGYLFDRRSGSSLTDSFVRIIPSNAPAKVNIAYSDIAALAFTGRDTAAGKTFEAWVKKYWEKKAAGERNIQIEPEKLD